MSLRALDRAYEPPHQGHAVQALSHQFEDLDQQNECYIVGMWTFLVTEIMFFGALFLAYSVYRTEYFSAYLDAHRFLSIPLGALNTFVLLASSLAMALGVHAAQTNNHVKLRAMLVVVIVCSFAFLGIKTVEYSAKIQLGLFPGPHYDFIGAKRIWLKENPGKIDHDGETWQAELETALHGPDAEYRKDEDAEKESATFQATPPSVDGRAIGYNTNVASVTGTSLAVAGVPDVVLSNQQESAHTQLFFCMYFCMTGLHAIHIIVGIFLMAMLWFLSKINHPSVQDYMPTELIGFYWHFVDIVWIFLFPMMYLLS